MELPICECATEWPGQGHHPECPVRREIERLRTALAAATERAEAAEAKNARACGCEWENGSQRIHGSDLDRMCTYHMGVERRAAEVVALRAALKHLSDLRDADRRERDALAARLAEVDGEHPA